MLHGVLATDISVPSRPITERNCITQVLLVVSELSTNKHNRNYVTYKAQIHISQNYPVMYAT